MYVTSKNKSAHKMYSIPYEVRSVKLPAINNFLSYWIYVWSDIIQQIWNVHLGGLRTYTLVCTCNLHMYYSDKYLKKKKKKKKKKNNK